jgi:plasmid stability protein
MKPRRTTVYLESDLHKALKIKAAETDRSVSDLVSAAVRRSLLEDADDLAVFKQRAAEPNVAFETVVRDLRRRGRL